MHTNRSCKNRVFPGCFRAPGARWKNYWQFRSGRDRVSRNDVTAMPGSLNSFLAIDTTEENRPREFLIYQCTAPPAPARNACQRFKPQQEAMKPMGLTIRENSSLSLNFILFLFPSIFYHIVFILY